MANLPVPALISATLRVTPILALAALQIGCNVHLRARPLTIRPAAGQGRATYVTQAGGTPTDAVSAGGAHGLTFGVADDRSLAPDVVHVSCHAGPKNLEQPWRDSCNPYAGDTSCSQPRPVLCIRRGNTGMPANLSAAQAEVWVNGELASTPAIAGQQLPSQAAADQFCAQQLGPGFRMAEFHDGNRGWAFTGRKGPLNVSERHWVAINDQPGNCWNSR